MFGEAAVKEMNKLAAVVAIPVQALLGLLGLEGKHKHQSNATPHYYYYDIVQ